MEIHQIAIGAGVYDAEYAQVQEGILPGSIETAPIPPSPPAAIPPPIETRTAAEPVEVRCDGLRPYRGRLVACGKLLTKEGRIPDRCPRCKKEYVAVAA
jgi:hypothetical protein